MRRLLREMSVSELETLLRASEEVHYDLGQLLPDIRMQIYLLKSKACHPKSYAIWQVQLADRVRALDDLINNWTNASKIPLDVCPMKSEQTHDRRSS
jgi:hypothetical protein